MYKFHSVQANFIQECIECGEIDIMNITFLGKGN